MRFIAEYALKSRTNAIIATALSAAIPFLFWIAAAVVSVVTLRKGAKDGSQVMLWGSLPALFWLAQGDLTPAFVIIGAYIMALVLRQSVSWAQTLLVGAGIGAITASTVQWLPPELMLELAQASREMILSDAELAENPSVELDQFLVGLFAGVISAVHALMMTGCLMLARFWQASLFNPGGFRQEFHQLRLPVWAGLVLGTVIVFGTGLTPEAIKWIPSLTLPLVFACIALVHAVVAIKQLSSYWLTAFYFVLFFAGHSLYVLMIFVALLDSSLNFRQRLTKSSDSDAP
jgi:hypothetical protein